MKAIGTIGAAVFAFGIATGAAMAMPQPSAVERDGLVTKIQNDCHADVRRHYLPEYGRRVWHRHRQNCRVVIVDREDDYDDRPRDCHREVRRHYLPEYGRSLYHRHVGDRCRVRIFERYEGDYPRGRNCMKLGPVTLCED